MRRFVALAVVLFVATSTQKVRATAPLVSRGPVVRSAGIAPRGAIVPGVTRLQPVVGSIQRTGRFTNPFTHKTKYTATAYNPTLGTFGTTKFRR
jgi:hypothetical protein